MQKLIKKTIIDTAPDVALRRKEVKNIVNHVFEALSTAIVTGQNVEIRDFGVFKSVMRKARVARNPQTGSKSLLVPERRGVKFKLSPTLKDRIARAAA